MSLFFPRGPNGVPQTECDDCGRREPIGSTAASNWIRHWQPATVGDEVVRKDFCPACWTKKEANETI